MKSKKTKESEEFPAMRNIRKTEGTLYDASVDILSKTTAVLSMVVSVSLIVLLLTGCNPQSPAKPLDSGAVSQAAEKIEPTLEAFKTDCIAYARDAFGVEPGKGDVNEDSILLTVAPALAGYWRVDIIETPSDEEYAAFMEAFENSPHWDHEWDSIETDLTYEQSAKVVSRLMDFCYEKALENGWTPGKLPEHADMEAVLESLRDIEITPVDPSSGSGSSETAPDGE